MTEINPSNYVGINATVVGYAASDPRPPAYDKSGERGILEVPIPIGHGYRDKETGDWKETSTTWVNLIAAGSGVGEVQDIRKGDRIRVDNARMETRQYTDKNGNARIGVDIRFGTVTVLEAADPIDDAPF